jgi:hypothetical protein
MLDQSFSAENFRIILDFENRKGVHVADKLSLSPIRKINRRIKSCNKKIKEMREAERGWREEIYRSLKVRLLSRKELKLSKELEVISKNITSKGFTIELKKSNFLNGKQIFTFKKTPENYFASKQTQRNIHRLFNVKQANRFAIIEQIKQLLSDQFPKYVIRTDIKNFYEDLPNNQLKSKIIENRLLSPLSRKIIRQVLDSYHRLSQSKNGVPRGVNISAYISELLMKDIDQDIRDISGVTYYARYVDDILIVFTPFPNNLSRDYEKDIKKIIEDKYGLIINQNKTQKIDLTSNLRNCTLEYLGYRIGFGTSNVVIDLSRKKISKYRDRITKSFDHYLNFSKVNEKKARKLLVKRIRFLTGNTKLSNNKKNIMVGIYYSNSQLTNPRQLNTLDSFLFNQINTQIVPANLKKRLFDFKFIDGFKGKRFSSFTTQELSDIMEIWK